jgi:hypothetical protein
MSNFRQTARNIFVWNYSRGSLQYDIICILILAFIFLVPRGCLVKGETDTLAAPDGKTLNQPRASKNSHPSQTSSETSQETLFKETLQETLKD